MNKKELAEVEPLKVKLALRFTEKIEPDLKKPEAFAKEMTKGWHFNSHSLLVGKACSTSINHSTWGDEKTTTQGGINMFSSRLLAIKAMRHEVEKECAEKLRKIDIMIEKENELNP
jgi:hypothetical protein